MHKTSDTNADYSSDAVEEATTYRSSFICPSASRTASLTGALTTSVSEVTEKIEAIKVRDLSPIFSPLSLIASHAILCHSMSVQVE